MTDTQMTKTKAQLRTAAVERLRKMKYVDDYGDWVEAIAEVVKSEHKSKIGDCEMWESLIDLLTDDDANDDSAPENVVSAADVDANDGNAAQDSREKLEADIREYWYPLERIANTSIGWLDRQAAITGREIAEGEYNPYYPTMWEELCYVRERNHELQAKVDELERENARLSSDELHWRNQAGQVDAIREARIDKLLSQRNELQAAYDAMVGKCAELCALAGFSMVDASGEVVS